MRRLSIKRRNSVVNGLSTMAVSLALLAAGCASPDHKTIQEQGLANWNEYRAAVKYGMADAELKKGNMNQAFMLAREVSGLVPNNPAHGELLARTYLAKGDFLSARRVLEAARRVHGDRPDIHYLLGAIYERAGRFADAAEAYRAAAHLQPSRVDHLVAQAQATASVDGSSAAIDVLLQRGAEFDGNPAYHLACAELYQRGGDLVKAGESYSRAMRLGADDRQTRETLGMNYYWQGRYREANDYLKPLALSTTEPSASLALAYPRCLMETGDTQRAAAWLEDATQDRAGDAALWLALAEARSALGQAGPAIEAALRATALDPKGTDAYTVLAALHLDGGDIDSASAAARAAIDNAPRNARAFMLLGQVYELRSDTSTAADLYRTARQLEPSNPLASQLLSNLKK